MSVNLQVYFNIFDVSLGEELVYSSPGRGKSVNEASGLVATVAPSPRFHTPQVFGAAVWLLALISPNSLMRRVMYQLATRGGGRKCGRD